MDADEVQKYKNQSEFEARMGGHFRRKLERFYAGDDVPLHYLDLEAMDALEERIKALETKV